MTRVLGRVLRVLGCLVGAVRRHPRTAVLSVIGALVAAGGGVYWYAHHQWRAAQAAIKADRPAEARDRLRFCLRVWPRSPEAHLLTARATRLTGDVEAAETHLNRCLQLQDGATEAVQLEFLLVRVQTGEVDEVAPLLIDTVDKGHPESPVILETLARAYIIRLRYKPAYACVSRWIELRPNDAKGYQWRGWVLERLNQQAAANADYHRALELDPELIPVRLRVAEMLLEDKQAPEALPHLEKLYQQAPNDRQVQARLGMCRFLQGRADDARRLMEAAVVHLPYDPALLVSLAMLNLQEGKGPEAERWLRTVLETDPSDTEALYTLVSVLQLQGRSEESAAVLKDYERKRAQVDRINGLLKDVADSPTARPDDYAEIGRLLMEIGRDKNGLYWLDRALERDSGNQQAHRALAAYHGRKGDEAKAAFHRRSVRESAPEAAAPRPNP